MAAETQHPAAPQPDDRPDDRPGDRLEDEAPFSARLPEEESPFDAATADEPVLWLQLVDAALRPHAGLAVLLTGPGGRLAAESADDGTVWIDGCVPGVYALAAAALGEQGAAVPTLFLSDLARDKRPYVVIL